MPGFPSRRSRPEGKLAPSRSPYNERRRRRANNFRRAISCREAAKVFFTGFGGLMSSALSLGFGAKREPGTFWIVVLLSAFFVAWTACLSIVNAPFPILHDMSEAYVWGREFQLGYNQHPPFWAWICGAWFLVFPRAGWAFAALGGAQRDDRTGRGVGADRRFRAWRQALGRVHAIAADAVLHVRLLQIRRQHHLPLDLAVDDAPVPFVAEGTPRRRRDRVRAVRGARADVEVLCRDPARDLWHSARSPPAISARICARGRHGSPPRSRPRSRPRISSGF